MLISDVSQLRASFIPSLAAAAACAAALAGLGAPQADAATSSLFVGRTSDGTALAALKLDGNAATAYVISGAGAWPVLRGTLIGTTAGLTGAKASGQATLTRDGAILRLGTGASARIVTLVRAGPGDRLYRVRSASGAVEAMAIQKSFQLRVAVSGATTSPATATPTIRTVVAAARLVELPDEVLADIKQDRELICRLLVTELGVLELLTRIERMQRIIDGLDRARADIEQKFNVGLPAPLITTRTQEIREVVKRIEEQIDAYTEPDRQERIAGIRARIEELGCQSGSNN